jgi:hypothetical protein
MEGTSNPTKYSQLKESALKAYAAYLTVPLWLRIVGTTLALTIIIDGAVLFFTLIGAFGYLSKRTQALILEDSIQIINAAFAILCAMELPYRLRASYMWLCCACRDDKNDDSTISTYREFSSTEAQSMQNATEFRTRREFLHANYPWSRHYWNVFGVLTITKVFQIFCQFAVEYLCLAYAGNDRFEQRPAFWFSLTIGFALPLGCGIGIIEGYYTNKAKEKDEIIKVVAEAADIQKESLTNSL